MRGAVPSKHHLPRPRHDGDPRDDRALRETRAAGLVICGRCARTWTATPSAPTIASWDEARSAWNLAVDQRPAAVVLAESAPDVVAAVTFAREHGLRIAPQGTGHGAAALGDLDGTILLRTSRMRGVEIDPRGADRPGRRRRALDRRRRGCGRAWPRRACRLLPGCRRRRLHARRRALVALPQVRDRREPGHGDRGRHGLGRLLPHRPRQRARPLLGAPRRRRLLRDRDRDRVQPLPDRGGLCGHPLVPGRACRGDPEGVARLDRRPARRDDVGRPDPPVPADPGDPGAGARQVVRGRRGDLARRAGRGRRVAPAAARPRPDHGHGRADARRAS